VADQISPPDSLTLARYLSGEASPAETASVERWIAADPANAELLESLRTIWTRREPPEFDPDDAVWNRIAAQLEQPPGRPALVPERVRSAARFGRWPARTSLRFLPAVAAAAVVLLISATVAVELRQREEPVAMREVETRRGQRAALYLPDGSRAVLAPESRLRFSRALGARGRGGSGSAREVWLEGQGYFEVQHDSTRAFRVRAANALVEDLGTEFVVAAYPERRGVEVVVVSGLVALRRITEDAGESPALLTLARSDLARLDSSGTAILTPNVNLAPYLAWTEGTLVFDATPLREVAPALGRWYDLDVRVADRALADRRLTASFRHEPVSQVLELIARSLDARVERDGRSVVFRLDSR
jgi:ferric-dicitrate binding protein FerR (iron transport regulator)